MINLKITLLFLSVAVTLVSPAQYQLRKWEVFELKLTAKNRSANPYAEIPATKEGVLQVTFSGVEGAAKGKSLTIFGFWYGGQIWKVRFAPPETGTWEYKSVSKDAGLNKARGRLAVTDWEPEAKNENATQRGLVQVKKDGQQPGHFFQYADGTPFLW